MTPYYQVFPDKGRYHFANLLSNMFVFERDLHNVFKHCFTFYAHELMAGLTVKYKFHWFAKVLDVLIMRAHSGLYFVHNGHGHDTRTRNLNRR